MGARIRSAPLRGGRCERVSALTGHERGRDRAHIDRFAVRQPHLESARDRVSLASGMRSRRDGSQTCAPVPRRPPGRRARLAPPDLAAIRVPAPVVDRSWQCRSPSMRSGRGTPFKDRGISEKSQRPAMESIRGDTRRAIVSHRDRATSSRFGRGRWSAGTRGFANPDDDGVEAPFGRSGAYSGHRHEHRRAQAPPRLPRAPRRSGRGGSVYAG
jgi:hypothetical protein